MLIHNMIMHINILNFNTSTSSAEDAENSGNYSDAYISLLPGSPAKISKPKLEIDLNEIQKKSVEEIQETCIDENQEMFIPKRKIFKQRQFLGNKSFPNQEYSFSITVKRTSVLTRPGKTPDRLKLRLPEVGERFLITVVTIESLSKIYGQLINPGDLMKILDGKQQTLIDLNLAITKDFSKNALNKVPSLMIGDLVLAFFPGDRLYYRATVLKVDGSMCKVRGFLIFPDILPEWERPLIVYLELFN